MIAFSFSKAIIGCRCAFKGNSLLSSFQRPLLVVLNPSEKGNSPLYRTERLLLAAFIFSKLVIGYLSLSRQSLVTFTAQKHRYL